MMENERDTSQAGLKSAIGTHVIIDLVLQAETERLEFDIVSDKEADFSAGFLGASTPLARAILGRASHSIIPYRVNDAQEVHILCVTQSKALPPPDAGKRHDEILRRAVEQSDRTNAMIFASSFSGKWGDYDPTGFEPDSIDPPNPTKEEQDQPEEEEENYDGSPQNPQGD